MNPQPIFRSRARTFWFASRLLPADVRVPVSQLYAFARVVDDLVDEPGTLEPEEVRAILNVWHTWLDAPVSAERAPDTLLAAHVSALLVEHGVPAQYLQLLVESVASDLDRREMQSWSDLRAYCFGVASSVGLAMCHLLGAGSDPVARAAAVDLGIAMQLTNILRDLREDMNLGRVYLPADELAAHGSSAEHLVWLGSKVATQGARAIDDRFRELMRYQIRRARAHYASGLEGVWRLAPEVRFAILVAGRLYSAILDVIEAADYDVFTQRASTSSWMKLSSTARWWVSYRARQAQLRPLASDLVRS